MDIFQFPNDTVLDNEPVRGMEVTHQVPTFQEQVLHLSEINLTAERRFHTIYFVD